MNTKEEANKISVLNEKGVADLRDLFSANWEIQNLPLEAKNAFEHFHYYYSRKKPPPLHDDEISKPIPALIIGSGHSFDDCIDVIANWKGAIFCSTSHIRALVRRKCYPDYIAAVDPRNAPDEWIMPKKDLEHMRKTQCTTYIFPPTGPIEFTKGWKGRKRLFMVADPTKSFYTHVLAPSFPWIKDTMIPFSSNLPALLALAQHLKYAPVYVIGGDFTASGFTQCFWENKKWRIVPASQNPEYPHKVMTYHGLPSNPNLMWSWRGMLCVLRINMENRHGKMWHVYNCRKDNALQNDLPYTDIQKVIKNQGRGQFMPWSHKHQMFRLDAALARFNTYILTCHNGVAFGGRPQAATTIDELMQKVDSLNATLLESKKIAKSVSKENLKKLPIKFDPDKIQIINKKEYLKYIREVRREAGIKDE